VTAATSAVQTRRDEVGLLRQNGRLARGISITASAGIPVKIDPSSR
jgi:hypothetical protein